MYNTHLFIIHYISRRKTKTSQKEITKIQRSQLGNVSILDMEKENKTKQKQNTNDSQYVNEIKKGNQWLPVLKRSCCFLHKRLVDALAVGRVFIISI